MCSRNGEGCIGIFSGQQWTEKLPGATLSRMRRVGLKVLKNRLSEYVRAAAAGETVLVTDGDRVVAELVPPRAHPNARPSDERFAEGFHAGWITRAPLAGEGVPPASPALLFEDLMDELREDRADR